MAVGTTAEGWKRFSHVLQTEDQKDAEMHASGRRRPTKASHRDEDAHTIMLLKVARANITTSCSLTAYPLPQPLRGLEAGQARETAETGEEDFSLAPGSAQATPPLGKVCEVAPYCYLGSSVGILTVTETKRARFRFTEYSAPPHISTHPEKILTLPQPAWPITAMPSHPRPS